VLELIRHRGLGLEQPDPDGDIWLVAVTDPPVSRESESAEASTPF
jgi:hypothetical protein